MANYDSDDSEAEFLIQHMPLEQVLAFVVARDDVRRIESPQVERDEHDDRLVPAHCPTMPASGVVARKMRAAS